MVTMGFVDRSHGVRKGVVPRRVVFDGRIVRISQGNRVDEGFFYIGYRPA